jgi:cysteinyl-tRNA synthetase
LKEFTERYFREFQEDLSALNVSKITQFPKASDYVDEMIDLTTRLLAKGYAYEKFRSIYFDISRLKDYGKLSRIDLEKIHLGKTVDLEQYEKGNPRDFTLFKRATLSELKKGIFYQTPWGNARPSWHLECPTMALKLLGDTHDIHTGGTDLVFPHHENAIAIGQATTGKPFANYWIHNELVMVEGKKASGEEDQGQYTIRSLLEKGYTGREIRLWLISHRYNKPISFSLEKLDAARNAVSHLDDFVRKLHVCQTGEPHPGMDQMEYNLKHGFTEAMNDDFNTSKALAALFEFTRDLNGIVSVRGLSEGDKEKAYGALKGIDSVLGVMDPEIPQGDEKIEALISERERARKDKNGARRTDPETTRRWALPSRTRARERYGVDSGTAAPSTLQVGKKRLLTVTPCARAKRRKLLKAETDNGRKHQRYVQTSQWNSEQDMYKGMRRMVFFIMILVPLIPSYSCWGLGTTTSPALFRQTPWQP